jgi:F0F1-type ATP synthase assembly protein I
VLPDKASVRVLKALKMQFFLMLLTGLGLSAISVVASYSLVLGGAIYSIPAYWALRRERRCRKSGDKPRSILVSMYSNEIAKFLFSMALFVSVFGLVSPLDGLVLLLAYIASQLLVAFFLTVVVK